MKCENCNYSIDKDTPYKDLWFNHTPEERYVFIVCPNDFNLLVKEPINSHRMILTFGKYEGKRVSELEDIRYLEYLDREDGSLLSKCIKQCI